MEGNIFSAISGLDFVRLLRSFATPQLDTFMRFVTMLGSAPIYLLLVLITFWCIDEKKGLHLGTIILIGVWVNLSLKLLFDLPRPFFEGYDPGIAVADGRLGGFPSGHAQSSLVVFIIVASWVKKKWLSAKAVSKAAAALPYIIAASICFLIGFSRVYLGVHFPSDVLGGWLIAGLLLCAYFFLHGKIAELLRQGGFRAGMIVSAVLSFCMIFNQPAEELLVPGGLMLGFGTGYCLNRRFIGFSAPVLSEKNGITKYLILAARCILGAVVLVLVFYASGKILPPSPLVGNYRLLGFFRFVLLGLWISAGAPWLFCKIKLSISSLSSTSAPQTNVPHPDEGQQP